MLTHRYQSILGDIPHDWQSRPLLSLLSDHFSGSWGDEQGEQEVQVIRSTNFNDTGYLDLSDVAKRYYEPKKANTICIKENDILIERSGGSPTQPVGRVGFATSESEGFAFSNFVQLLRPDKKKANSSYLSWVLFELNRSGIVERLQHQTTQMRNLDYRDYIRVSIPIPLISEQERIAKIINLSNEAIENTNVELQAARRLKTAFMKQLFTKGIPGRHKKFKETKIGLIPYEWDVIELRSIAKVQSGITLNQERAPKKNTRQYLTVINVQRERIDLSEVRFLEMWDSEIPERLLVKGDILVVEGHANSSEIGRAAMVPEEAEGMTYQNHLFRVRPLEGVSYNKHFLLGCLNNEKVRRHWNAMANTSSGLNTINRRGLRKLVIPKPREDEQLEITALLETANNTIESYKNKVIATTRLKKSLLQNLLTGEVRVNMEAAHELLRGKDG